jgi:hypothetical protein
VEVFICFIIVEEVLARLPERISSRAYGIGARHTLTRVSI